MPTINLLPNGTGTYTQMIPVPTTSNYLNADDPAGSPDDGSTYNNATGSFYNLPSRDTYTLQNLPANITIITKITLVIRFTENFTPPGSATRYFSIIVGGILYEYSFTYTYGSGWVTFTYDLVNSPKTGVAWTASEINSMEAGANLFYGSKMGYSSLTQVYVIVTYPEDGGGAILI